MTDAAIAARIHAAFLDAMLPAWAGHGSCAEKAPNRAPWSPMFADDVSHRPRGDYDWPSHVIHAMNTCAGCPVRTECLAYALASETREEQTYWASDLEDVSDGRRFGVYGGVPGRIRERYRDHYDPFGACDAWFHDRYPQTLVREDMIAT